MPYRIVNQDKTEGDSNPLKCQFFVIKSEKAKKRRETNCEIKKQNGKGTVKTKRKDNGNRRVYHNEVERQRRNKINAWITELGKLIVKEDSDRLSKIQVLEQACQYVEDSKAKSLQMRNELRKVTCQNRVLIEENEKLKKELRKRVA